MKNSATGDSVDLVKLCRFPFRPERATARHPVCSALWGTGIQSLRSSSIQGLSVITIVFRSDNEVYRDRQLVSERLTTVAGQLPSSVQAPIMTPPAFTTGDATVLGLTSDRQSMMTLRAVAEWMLQPRLSSVPANRQRLDLWRVG